MAPPPPSDGHSCGWQARAIGLESDLEELRRQLEALKKQLHGRKSEKKRTGKMPPAVEPKPSTSAQLTRALNREAFEAVVQTETEYRKVDESQRTCPKCGNTHLRNVGDGKGSTTYVFVAAHFRKQVRYCETLACDDCGDYIVTATAPDRPFDKTRYDSSFIAHVVVSKCSDSRAQYNLAKEYQRVGIPISRSTINSLFHRAAAHLEPLGEVLLNTVACHPYVQCDETTMRMQTSKKKAYLWAFLGGSLVAYRFSTGRSGDTPAQVLGDSEGNMLCDAYTGYNKVTKVGRRKRSGCMAHARRHVFEAAEDPQANEAMDLIKELYEVERDARAGGLVGTAEHGRMRHERSRSPYARLLWWARRVRRENGPKTPLGIAARYIVDNFRELGRFLHDPKIAIDNNATESCLRRVAQGRARFLFVHDEECGKRLATLYSLVASAELCHLNPVLYIADVLLRIDRHPKQRLRELLPDVYKPSLPP